MNSIAIIWAQFGPYHFARVAGLRAVAGSTVVHAIELSDRTEEYSWQRGENDAALHTLVCGQASERLGFWKVYLRIRRKLAELKPEVCFLPSYWPKQSLAAVLAARSLGVRTVMMNETHAGTARASGLVANTKRPLLRLFDASLVGGSPQKRYFESLGFESHKIFTGYDAVDNNHFETRAQFCRENAATWRQSYQLPERYFLNLGRFVAKKNLDTLVQAYRKYLLNASGQCHLVLVGAGPEETALKCLCHKLRLAVYDKARLGKQGAESGALRRSPAGPGVHFYGFRQIEENPIFYGLAEAFVLPSRSEEWGLVVNEAMASGLPVVVSEKVGCAEDLLEFPASAASPFAGANDLPLNSRTLWRRNGFVFAPDSSDQLAHILVALEKDEETRREMGQHSRMVIEKFSCQNFGRNALAAARCALGNGTSPSMAIASQPSVT